MIEAGCRQPESVCVGGGGVGDHRSIITEHRGKWLGGRIERSGRNRADPAAEIELTPTKESEGHSPYFYMKRRPVNRQGGPVLLTGCDRVYGVKQGHNKGMSCRSGTDNVCIIRAANDSTTARVQT